MKLSPSDRIQATVRHPQYLKDYFYILGLKAKAPKVEIDMPFLLKEYEITKKWGLPCLIGPKDVHVLIGPKDVHVLPFSPVFTISDKAFEIRSRITTQWKYSTERKPIKKGKKLLKEVMKEGMKKENVIAVLKEGRYLTLRLDLWANKEELLKGVEGQIKYYFRYANRPKGRIRESTYPCYPWEVYDMHRDGGKNLLKIAKEIFGFKRNPTYNSQAKAKYQQVISAYNKAVKMIKAVTPTTNPPV